MGTMRFNHMELTFARGELDENRRRDIRSFYGEVLGWAASDVEILGQTALLLQADETVSQFILLAEGSNPIQSPGYDHLGLLVESRKEVDDLLAACRRWAERDERIQIKEYPDLEQGTVTAHAFYVKYLLPIWFDIQCLEWQPGSEPTRRWSYG